MTDIAAHTFPVGVDNSPFPVSIGLAILQSMSINGFLSFPIYAYQFSATQLLGWINLDRTLSFFVLIRTETESVRRYHADS